MEESSAFSVIARAFAGIAALPVTRRGAPGETLPGH